MASVQDKPSSFYVVCFGDISTKIEIPYAFVRKHREFLREEFLELKVDESSRVWNVEIKILSDKHFYIDGGWSEFVKDNHLCAVKFVTFRIVGKFNLHVSVFGNNACLEQPSPPPPPCRRSCLLSLPLTLFTFFLPNLTTASKLYEGGETRRWRFVTEVKQIYLAIPLAFAEAAGLKKHSKLKFVDGEGRKWAFIVADRNYTGLYAPYKTSAYRISRGIKVFYNANNIRIGSIMLFELIPNSDYVKVVKVEEQVGKELLAQAGRGGVLP